MKIKVLGPGCPKCKKLFSEAEKAIAEAGVKADLEKVDRIEEFIRYGVLTPPGLVIDEEVKSTGRIPPSSEIADWIKKTTR
jgi:small redox-active disulfide protein 2